MQDFVTVRLAEKTTKDFVIINWVWNKRETKRDLRMGLKWERGVESFHWESTKG